MIGIVTVDRRGKIARGIEGRAVRAKNETGRHAVRFEIDDLRPLALL